MNDSILEVIEILEKNNMNRIDFRTESNKEVTAYKVGNIVRIDIKVK